MNVKKSRDKQRNGQETQGDHVLGIGSKKILRNHVCYHRTQNDGGSHKDEYRWVETVLELRGAFVQSDAPHNNIHDDVSTNGRCDIEPSLPVEDCQNSQKDTEPKDELILRLSSNQTLFALRYSLQMILTTSGIVAILRAFLSSSKSRSISGVMATVIFGVGFFGVLFTRVRWHKKVYNGIGGIGW